MLWNMIRVEQEKMFRLRLCWIMLAVLTFLIPAGFSYVLLISKTVPNAISPDNLAGMAGPYGTFAPLAILYAYNITGILAVVLVGSFVGQEYAWRTMQLWISHGVQRWTLLGAKLIVICGTMLVLLLAIFILSRGFSLLLSGLFFSALPAKNAPAIGWLDAVYVYGSVFLTILPYAALTFLLAVVARSSLIAVGGGLTLVIIGESVLAQILRSLGSMGTQIANILPATLGAQLIETEKVNVLSHGPAVLGILLYTVVFLGIACWQFQRQELPN